LISAPISETAAAMMATTTALELIKPFDLTVDGFVIEGLKPSLST